MTDATEKCGVGVMDSRKDVLPKTTKEEYGNSYRDKIVEMIGRVKDEWILKIIHNFITEMIKEGG